MVELPDYLHKAWHQLFSNWTPQKIAQTINQWYIDPDFILVAQRRNDERPNRGTSDQVQ